MMDAKVLTTLTEFLKREWFEKTGLAASAIAAFLAGAIFLAGGDAPGWERAITGAALAAATGFGWWLSRRPPKTSAGRVGVLVSIVCDDDEESKRLRADFLNPLRRLIADGESGKRLQFIELPRHLTQNVLDRNYAEQMRVSTNAHFMLYGQVRRRMIGGVDSRVLDLAGIVAHKPIPSATSKQLAREFSELFPSRVTMPAEADLLGFEFTSELADAVARYIIGIAAAVSGDLEYAERLYSDVHGRLNPKRLEFPIYRKLWERLPRRFAEIHMARANAAYLAWQKGRERKYVDELGEHLAKLHATGAPPPEPFFTLSAIHSFLGSRNVSAALSHLKKLKAKNSLWNLNQAFLLGYKGDLRGASRHYKAAARYAIEPEILSQVDDFLSWLQSEEPDKYQLSYCSALFQMHVKGDKAKAIGCFRAFLSAGKQTEFPKERELSGQWLAELEGELELAHV